MSDARGAGPKSRIIPVGDSLLLVRVVTPVIDEGQLFMRRVIVPCGARIPHLGIALTSTVWDIERFQFRDELGARTNVSRGGSRGSD